jgi:site-specific DNA-methyltransferase (adenine-specific)
LLSTYGGEMTKPYYVDQAVTLYHGDCRKVMASLAAASVDAIVTDPPYELGFMGKRWDASGIAYDEDVWAQAHRVLKPGGHLLAFGGTRTWHRLAVAIEDAGFEVRDSIAWMYGSGFPKSLDVSKAIDKRAGVEFAESPASGVGFMNPQGHDGYNVTKNQLTRVGESTPAAQQWQGWGTALKPAFEPIVVARKPLDGTVAENVLRCGTGALNIDGSRIGTGTGETTTVTLPDICGGKMHAGAERGTVTREITSKGRWPANVILDESQAAELDKQSGSVKGGTWNTTAGARHFNNDGETTHYETSKVDDSFGGASRFFYVPKANANERPRDGDTAHPTVKPLDLMRYLVKLVTPPGGTVLEPFAGSGTTLEACVIEGFNVIGIELTEDYLPLIMQRITKPIEVTLL